MNTKWIHNGKGGRTLEYGSVLELDDLNMYRIPDAVKEIRLPFMGSDDYNTVFYQSGRNAIESLLLFLKNEKNIRCVLLPDYICDTVADAAERAGVEIKRYLLDKDYGFDISEVNGKATGDCCIYICHYFGTPVSDEVIEAVNMWKSKGICVIEDVTMSLLSRGESVGFGDYILGSLRKWFPIPDGGFVSSKTSVLPEEPVRDKVSKYTDYYLAVQMMKRQYICGGCKDPELKDLYLSYYKESIRELFSDYKIYPISDWSYNYLQNVDIESVRDLRIRNYDLLYDLLKDVEGISVKVKRSGDNIPFGMVILSDKRDELLSELIKNDLYCNVHWRLTEDVCTGGTDGAYLSAHSITVPCDQRYSEENIRRIADIIKVSVKSVC